MRTALGAILLMATATVALADQPSRYLCVAERSADLRYDSHARTWAARAVVTGDSFVLRRLSDDDRKSWVKRPVVWGFFRLDNGREVSPAALCDVDLKCFWGAAEFDKPSGRPEGDGVTSSIAGVTQDGSLTWRLYKGNRLQTFDRVIVNPMLEIRTGCRQTVCRCCKKIARTEGVSFFRFRF